MRTHHTRCFDERRCCDCEQPLRWSLADLSERIDIASWDELSDHEQWWYLNHSIQTYCHYCFQAAANELSSQAS